MKRINKNKDSETEGAFVAKGETKRESFIRLATRRTNAVLNHLRILSHCANPQLYEYSQDDVKRIFRAIEAETRAVKAKFVNSSRSEFKL
ncbi:MAG: hypothetical protein AB1603_03235 [Chloroflexota bacterium]